MAHTLTTEILIFETSESYRNDSSIITSGFDIALKADGAHFPIYHGLQIENPSTGYIFLNWDSFEAHKAFIDSPVYGPLGEKLLPSFRAGGKTEMYHVQFSSATVALEKPVTEVLILSLKAPENRAALVDVLTRISELSEKMIVFGQIREDENKFILIGGWASVEAHQEAIARPEVIATLEKVQSLANKDHFYHAKLLQYTPAN